MRFLLPAAALLLVACASSPRADSEASTQDQTATPLLLDGQTLSAQQLGALVPSDSAAILFPSSGDPEIRGRIVEGGKVTVVYALNRLPQCRASHDGFEIWDTRLGGEFSNGTKIGEERGAGADGQPQGSLRSFPGSSSTGTAHSAPLTIDVPVGAESFFLYAHNTSAAGPASACDTFDSKLSANFQFTVDGSGASADPLASLADIGDGSDTAEILFASSGEPIVRGNLVQGGRVFVVFALERLSQCRALHDGFPYWLTQIGGVFSDGTKVGEGSAQTVFMDASREPGHVVRFGSISAQEGAVGEPVPTEFQIPAGATDLSLWAHNWNPGGPVSACSAFDSRNGANYHFPIRSR